MLSGVAELKAAVFGGLDLSACPVTNLRGGEWDGADCLKIPEGTLMLPNAKH